MPKKFLLLASIVVVMAIGTSMMTKLGRSKADTNSRLQNVATMKGTGNRQAAIDVVNARLKTTEKISVVELGEIARSRRIVFLAPTLTNQVLRIHGTVSDTRWMENFSVSATNVTSEQMDMVQFFAPIQADGNFDISIELTKGSGLYEVSVQAPWLRPHEVDDISYGPTAMWSVRLQ